MKKFNLDEYLKNPTKKVVTRDGRNVRIICTDKKGFDYPIVALIENKLEGLEGVLYYTKDGEYTANGSSDSDLFFATEKRKGWINIFNDGDERAGTSIFNSKKKAEEIGKLSSNYVTSIRIEW